MLAFLDADDLWQPHKLSLQIAVLETRTNMDMVFCQAEQFISEDAQHQVTAIPERLRIMPAMNASGLLLWRKAFDRVGQFDTEYTRTDFVDWVARASHAGLRQVILPEVLVRRRWHDANLGMTERNNTTDYTRVVKAALDRRRASLKAT
jgi:GT2 family glycosyltransferase